MKKGMTIFGAILFASTILMSCGGGDKEDTTEVTIKPKSTSIKGDLGDYFEVVDKDYIIKVSIYNKSIYKHKNIINLFI